MADNNDDSFNNDLQFGPITVDVPDNLDDIKRDLKFYKNVGEFIDTKEVGKLANVLGQPVGLTSTGKMTNEVLKHFKYLDHIDYSDPQNPKRVMKSLDQLPLGPVSQKFRNAADEAAKTVSESQRALKNMTKTFERGISQARMALTVVDFVSKYIFGVSIVDEWLKKPFFGDWDELEETAGKWDAMAASLSTVQAAIQEISANVNETSWAGAAADMFVERNNAAAEVVGDGCQPCSEMSQALNALAQNAQDAFDLVLDTIDEIISLLKLIAGELIIPGAGPILATVTAAAEIAQAIQWGIEIVNCLNNLYTAFMGFANCISVMQTLVGKSEGVKMSFGTGSSSGGNGSGGSGGGSFGGR